MKIACEKPRKQVFIHQSSLLELLVFILSFSSSANDDCSLAVNLLKSGIFTTCQMLSFNQLYMVVLLLVNNKVLTVRSYILLF